MLDLIPIELHRYSLSDLVLNLVALRKFAGKQATINLPGLGDGIPIRSARAALIIALKTLGVPPGSRIGIPL